MRTIEQCQLAVSAQDLRTFQVLSRVLKILIASETRGADDRGQIAKLSRGGLTSCAAFLSTHSSVRLPTSTVGSGYASLLSRLVWETPVWMPNG